jgi:uncharacterized membrane protein
MVNNFVFGGIIETIEGYLQPLITSALSLLEGFPVWVQGLILLALALFAVIGVFVFIKKFFKLFLVLAILGAIGYYLYTEGIITDLLGNLTGTILTTLL